MAITSHPPLSLRRLAGLVIAGICGCHAALEAAAQEDGPDGGGPPIRILLLTGGANHDYEVHRRILTRGIEERCALEIDWTVALQLEGRSDVSLPVFEEDSGDETYDLVLHHYCFSRVRDRKVVDRVLRPHLQGTPAVLLHATLASFPLQDDDGWSAFCGVEGVRHGGFHPLQLVPTSPDDPAWGDRSGWTTPWDELYLVERVLEGTTVLAESRSPYDGIPQASVWRHRYGPNEARVFATSVGHSTATLADPPYLDMVTRGVLWALGRSGDEDFVEVLPEESLSGLELHAERGEIAEPLRLGRNALLGAEARASTSQAEGGRPSRAVDGDPGTSWRAAEPGPASLTLRLAREETVEAVALLWEGRRPEQFVLEGRASGDAERWEPLWTWTALELPSSDSSVSFRILSEPRLLNQVRLTVPVSEPGEILAVREIAAYTEGHPVPGALLVSHEPDLILKTQRGREGGAAFRLRAGWETQRSLARSTRPGRPGLLPCSSGECFLYWRNEESGLVESVELLRFDDSGEIRSTRFLSGRAGMGGAAWDGEWLYLLEGGALVGFRDLSREGVANEQIQIARVFTLPHSLGEAPVLESLQLASDGWFYALWRHAESLTVRCREGGEVLVPPLAMVRFRHDGREFQPLSPLDGEVGALSVDESLRAFLTRNGAEERRFEMLRWGGLQRARLDHTAAEPLPDRLDRSVVLHDREAIWLPESGAVSEAGPDLAPPVLHLLARGKNVLAAAAYRGGILVITEDGEGFELSLLGRSGESLDPVVDIDAVPDSELPSLLREGSGTARRDAVFELLRRKRLSATEGFALLKDERPSARMSGAALLALSPRPEVFDAMLRSAREGGFPRAFHFLADDPRLKNHAVFGDLNRVTDPEATVSMLEAVLRSGTELDGLEDLVLSFAALPDELLSEASIRFLVERESIEACFAALDDAARVDLRTAAFRVLGSIHRIESVEGIRTRLAGTRDPEFRRLALEALCRLAFIDDEALRSWEGSEGIVDTLEEALRNPRVDRVALLDEMSARGIRVGDAGLWIDLGKEHLSLEPMVVALLGETREWPREARPFLEEIARSPSRDDALKAEARRLLEVHGRGADPGEAEPAAGNRRDRDDRGAAGSGIELESGSLAELARPGERVALASALWSVSGDPDLGWEVFQRVRCGTCHNIHGEGPERAPDLVRAALGLGIVEFAEAVRHPAPTHAEGFESRVVELDNGLRFSTAIEEEGEAEWVLRDIAWNRVALPKDRVRLFERSERSLMPDDLVEGLLPEEFAALHAFLRRLGGGSL